jgi:hypothetical protein
MAEKINWKGLAEFSILLAIVLIVSFSVTNLLGNAAAAFEELEYLNYQSYYIAIGLSSALILLVLKLVSILLTKGDKIFGDSLSFADLGEVPHIRFFRRFTYPQITLLAIIFMFIIALLNFQYGQQSFTGVLVLPVAPQQFTPIQSALFSSLLIPGPENLGAQVLIAGILIAVGFIARKYNWNINSMAVVFVVLATLLTGAFGALNHLLNPLYRDSQVDLIRVFGFWSVGGFITAVTGFFVIFWIMHIINNGLYDFGRLFASDTVTTITYIIIAILIVLYFIIYNRRLLGDKNRLKNR